MILPLPDIADTERGRFGHKAWALGTMIRAGFDVPSGVALSTDAYRTFVEASGLQERIALIVRRKRTTDMRWEELWDASLRVRNLFLATPLPADLQQRLASPIRERFGDRPVAVRSSAPGEDSAAASFAGLHDSYLNVRGAEAILDHVRRVWASLWSDGALAYDRQSPAATAAAMAVVIQDLVPGEVSGVAFGEAPDDPRHVAVECVYGLNEGLVDGSVEPDRWILRRGDGAVLRHDAGHRERKVVAAGAGVRFAALAATDAAAAPLHADQVAQVFALVRDLETLFGAPQDVEWTFSGRRLVALQARPITARGAESPVARSVDGRSWTSSLRKSLDYLLPLRERVETELMPELLDEIRSLGEHEPAALSDRELAAEIHRRQEALERWEHTYAEELIPLAHAVRLFGLFYNESLRPEDPYEFLGLLAATPMEAVRRNRALEAMAATIRGDPALGKLLRDAQTAGGDPPPAVAALLDPFLEEFGHSAWGQERCFADPRAVVRHLLQLAARPGPHSAARPADPGRLRDRFLDRFQGEERDRAAALLELARASYRLRDDDNIAVGGIRSRLLEAVDEGRHRLSGRPWASRVVPSPEEAAQALLDPSFEPRGTAATENASTVEEPDPGRGVRARQIVGQPAGPGVATGRARVVLSRSDLFAFGAGEVLVCDAVEPNMTFVVPLAAAVVERRGGMLIHGAIIAREYGLPCVTGVPQATRLIGTGDTLTVDGHLGIVIVE